MDSVLGVGLFQLTTFVLGILLYIASFKTLLGVWRGGRVVGKSDFNENPVVSLGLGLWTSTKGLSKTSLVDSTTYPSKNYMYSIVFNMLFLL